jgi:putative DNA primase/helicase
MKNAAANSSHGLNLVKTNPDFLTDLLSEHDSDTSSKDMEQSGAEKSTVIEAQTPKCEDRLPVVYNEATGQVERKSLISRIGSPLANLTMPKMVVQHLFEQNALSIIFGPSMSYKSFVTIDLACSVAAGLPFHGHKTKKMAVVYVAGEGRAGVGNRVAAWEKENGICMDDHEFFITDKSVQFLSDGSAAEMLAEDIEKFLKKCQLPLGFVFIDTISRNFGDGDESNARDVAKFLDIIDTHLRYKFQTNVCCIGHSGLEAGRIRGSTAWISGMDQQYETVKRGVNGMIELKCHKMKEGRKPEPLVLQTKSIFLISGDDGFGEQAVLDSLVLVTPTAVEIPTSMLKGRNALTPDALIKFLINGWQPSTKIAEFFGCSARDATACVKECVELGLLVKNGRKYDVTRKGKDRNNSDSDGLCITQNNT